MNLQLRVATLADIPAIQQLYALEVREGAATYEYDVPDQAEMAQRMRELQEKGFPYLVAELDGVFAGYAYASSYRSRIGYRWTVEDTVYVQPGAKRKGVGRTLLAKLMQECATLGFRQMVAVIGEPGNGASVALHEKLGFSTIGIFPGMGRKHGRWLDTVQMQCALGRGDGDDPADET
ncbi:MAG: N-acetyltransferase family protein [Pseudoxanthomonas sp.]